MGKEIWKPVANIAGYEASDKGRVRRFGRIKSQRRHKDGYLRVQGEVDGKNRQLYVHQLVLAAFVGPRPEGQVCRHLDGDPLNNRIENLAYGTQKQNLRDRERHGTAPTGVRNGRAKLNPSLVRLVRLARKGGASYNAIADAVNMSAVTIRQVCRGELWKDVA